MSCERCKELESERAELLFTERNLGNRLKKAVAAQDTAEAEQDKYLTQNTDLRKQWEEMRAARDEATREIGDVRRSYALMEASNTERTQREDALTARCEQLREAIVEDLKWHAGDDGPVERIVLSRSRAALKEDGE